MSDRFRLPDTISTTPARSPSRFRSDTIWADARIAPMKAYFEFDAQPAMMMPYTSIEVIAISNSRPALTLASATSGPNGTTAQAASAGMMVMIGPMTNRLLFALVGMMISLNSSLSASAIGCSRPSGPDAVRADADLDPADQLALPQGQVGNQAHQRQQHAQDLDQGPDERPDRCRGWPRPSLLIESIISGRAITCPPLLYLR